MPPCGRPQGLQGGRGESEAHRRGPAGVSGGVQCPADLVRACARATNTRARGASGPKEDVPTQMPQSEAKKYIPPGCFIWQAVSHSAWAGRCDPFKRISPNWSIGDDNARRDIVTRLWCQRLAKRRCHCRSVPIRISCRHTLMADNGGGRVLDTFHVGDCC